LSLLPDRTRAINAGPLFLRFSALAVDDGGGWTGFRSLVPTLFIEHVVDSFHVPS